MDRNALGILRQYDLRHTDTRENILNGFLQKTTALSHSDIEVYLNDGFDRVTIYRTLKTFLDKGIIHKILDDNGGVKYALCKDQCASGHHHHDHVHFKCSECNETFCFRKISDSRNYSSRRLPKKRYQCFGARNLPKMQLKTTKCIK